MVRRRRINGDQERRATARIGLNWTQVDLVQFRRGLEVEIERGLRNPETKITDNYLVLTGRIAFAHVSDRPDYYRRLNCLETEAANEAEASAYAYWGE